MEHFASECLYTRNMNKRCKEKADTPLSQASFEIEHAALPEFNKYFIVKTVH